MNKKLDWQTELKILKLILFFTSYFLVDNSWYEYTGCQKGFGLAEYWFRNSKLFQFWKFSISEKYKNKIKM